MINEDVVRLNAEKMAGLSFLCNCGKSHCVGIDNIIVDSDVLDRVAFVAQQYRWGKVFIVSDINTQGVYAKRVEDKLLLEGFDTVSFVFNNKHLIPDEAAVGRLLIEIDDPISLILAVGSGTINDLARYISKRLKIPYMIVATAPSMDGYASVVSPLIVGGTKKTYEAVYPKAVIADNEVLSRAPDEMILAGFGDIIGKMTALADWQLSAKINNEYYCHTSAELVKNALNRCVKSADWLMMGDKQAVSHLFEALLLSGVAMGLVGNSRPASGAEHHLAHYWEVQALKIGMHHPLHGNSVGAATVVIASVYEYMYSLFKDEDDMPKVEVPTSMQVIRLLEMVGAAHSPEKLGIPREIFYQSMIHAMEIRPRYTIFHLVKEKGLLEEMANILTERFY